MTTDVVIKCPECMTDIQAEDVFFEKDTSH